MPFTLLSHQAPVLPLKMLRPRWFCGTALAIGSMAPDLEYFFHGDPTSLHGHTLAGQLYFCLPLTLALVWVVRSVVAEPLALHLPDAPPLHMRDYRVVHHTPGRARASAIDLLRVVTSALIGSLSHLFLDGFTHDEGWAVQLLPALRPSLFELFGKPVPGYRLLQGGGSLLLALLTLWMLGQIGRRRLLLRWASPVPPSRLRPTAASRRVLLLSTVLFTAGGTLFRVGVADSVRAFSHVWYWGHEVLQAACFGFIGLCVGAVAARRRMTPIARPVSVPG
jgi:hypothetical protein